MTLAAQVDENGNCPTCHRSMVLTGSEVASMAGAPEHAKAIEAMLQQLLIVLIKRGGGSMNIPVAEIDGTGGDMLGFQILPDGKTFHFKVSPKS